MTRALYNEIEPFAVRWLANLEAAGHIAPGAVDGRSIKDLAAADLAGAIQCHFFAGIGVWSHALRAAGWPDDVPVWTGSCPCQPFSAAGRGGGIDDARHLWPEWFRLIRECRPPVVFGEQVASPAGLAWLDAVRADLEGAGYAFGVSDLCAAGVGAPHIRQRLYFVAYDHVQRREGLGVQLRQRRPQPPLSEADRGGSSGVVDDDDDEGLEGHTGDGGRETGRPIASRSTPTTSAPGGVPAGTSAPERLGDSSRSGSRRHTGTVSCEEREGYRERQLFGRVVDLAVPSSHVGGFWGDAEWILCRDGKARPIEPGTFPLANGASARVGRLHAYGNAIVAPLAIEFVKAVIEILLEGPA